MYAQRLFTRPPQEALDRPQQAALRRGTPVGAAPFLTVMGLLAWVPIGFGQQTNPADGELGAFRKTLSELRAGDEGVATKLLQLAETLCVDFARCDTLAVTRYYLRLTPGQRARGLEAEKTFLALHERVVQAGRGELPPERDWPSERAALYAEIGSLASQVEGREDVVPAAQSYALLARLELSELEQDLDLSDARSQQLLGLVAAHIDRSLLLFERAGQVTPRLEPLWLRGRLARARAEHGRAREVFEDCLRLARDVSRFEYQERALSGLVDLAKDAGNLREVDEHLATWALPSASRPVGLVVRPDGVTLVTDFTGDQVLVVDATGRVVATWYASRPSHEFAGVKRISMKFHDHSVAIPSQFK